MSENKNLTHNSKKSFLQNPVEHIDITSFDARKIISSMEKMSFVSRETANAANIFNEMIQDKDCTIFLTLAGSTSAAGCMNIYKDLVKYNMVDAIIATGASIVDMDFFEALGFKHYQGSQFQDDTELRKNYIDRIYDTYIDEEELQECDQKICEIADTLDPRSYTSREFIYEMGKYLKKNSKKKDSLIETAYDNNVPIFCPAFTDSSAGFGLVTHQENNPKNHITIDSIRELRELTEIKIQSKGSGLFMIGGGVPKNFVQDTVICAELLGKEVEMHKYAVQITVADSRDGACSSSTLKEASSWGKVDITKEQMVFAEATSVLPLIASDVYHKGELKKKNKLYQFMTLNLWGVLPSPLQRGISSVYANVYNKKWTKHIIKPYCKAHYSDPNYIEQFKAARTGKDTFESFQDFFTRVYKDGPKITSKYVWACEGLLCQYGLVADLPLISIKGDRRNIKAIFGKTEEDIPGAHYFSNIFSNNSGINFVK